MRKQAGFSSLLLVALCGAAAAQQQPASGHTSGPAVGRNVTPSTVAQKLFEGRSASAGGEVEAALDVSATSAGWPGLAGKAGTQSGEAPRGREAAAKAVY